MNTYLIVCFVTSSFGLLVWGQAPTFGIHTTCNPHDVHFSLFGADLNPTGPLRIVVLTLCKQTPFGRLPFHVDFNTDGIWSALYLFAFLLDVPVFLLPRIIPRLESYLSHTHRTRFTSMAPENRTIFSIITIYNISSLVVSILILELTVHANRSALNVGDEQWTLGQVSAMIMLVVPFISLGKLAKEQWKETVLFVRGKLSMEDRMEKEKEEAMKAQAKEREEMKAAEAVRLARLQKKQETQMCVLFPSLFP